MLLYHRTFYDMISYDIIPYDMIWYYTIRYDTIYDPPGTQVSGARKISEVRFTRRRNTIESALKQQARACNNKQQQLLKQQVCTHCKLANVAVAVSKTDGVCRVFRTHVVRRSGVGIHSNIAPRASFLGSQVRAWWQRQPAAARAPCAAKKRRRSQIIWTDIINRDVRLVYDIGR